MTPKKDWHGLMRILWLEHIRDGKIIRREENVCNVLHFLGEQFLLSALFTSGNNPNSLIPNSYYLGLDARPTISVSDTMENLVDEPFVNGYYRQAVNSTTGFTIQIINGIHCAVSPIIAFSAVGGSWGPVLNIFLSDQSSNAGTLISSAPLTNPVTVMSGDSVNMRMAMSLHYAPSS